MDNKLDRNVSLYKDILLSRMVFFSPLFFLFISVQPHLIVDIPSSHEITGLQDGTSLNITVNLLANPTPTMQWVFRKNDSIDNIITSNSNSNGFEYKSNIFIQEINKTQFGSYIVIATNNIGRFNKTFSVNQKGKYYIYFFFNVIFPTFQDAR
jgi:hypothetical protein